MIDGHNAGSIILDTDCVGSIVQDLTFTRGRHAGGGAIRITAPESLIIANCIFHENTATSRGGAIHISAYATPTSESLIIGCVFHSNTAVVNAGAIWSSSRLRVENCVFEQNTCGGSGGAVNFYTRAVISGSRFEGNRAGMDGGAVAVYPHSPNGPPVCSIDHCSFSSNSAEGSGGATAYVYVISDSVIENNRCGNNGGGVYIASQVVSCVVESNWAADSGGGAYMIAVADDLRVTGNHAGACGGGLYFHVAWGIQRCIFEYNTAQEAAGAYIRTMDPSDDPITHCKFLGNTASELGGVTTSLADLRFRHCSFIDNTAPSYPVGVCHDLFLECTETDPADWSAWTYNVDDSECGVANETMSFGRLKELFG